MIATVLRVSWINLRRDRIAQAMSFLLPILFFSVFAIIFGRQGRDTTNRINIAVVDEDQSELSRRLIAALEREDSLRVRTTKKPTDAKRGANDADADDAKGSKLDRRTAESLVRDGTLPVALILPSGLEESFKQAGGLGGGAAVELLADTSDPVAPQMVGGLLQKVTMTAAPDLFIESGLSQFERFAGALTPDQRDAVDRWLPQLRAGGGFGPTAPAVGDAPDASRNAAGLIGVRTVDVLGETKASPVIAFYAAGTGVMFLLFMCSAAGGALLEEAESGTLDRLLSSSLGMGGLLAGKWLYLTACGVIQVTIMFVWGAMVFHLELWSHLPGFALMTLATASAAASFGLVLATACRSRGQLSGISTIVILIMSAIGGSMFPRFLMSESLQRFGLFTFNAWALDGYVKVFWRDATIWQLWPQLGVLSLLATVFFAVARLLARRWETV